MLETETYTWKNGAWVGKMKYYYEYDEEGNGTLLSYAAWDTGLNDWLWIERVVRVFNSFNKATSDHTDFWVDGEWKLQGITEYEYDEAERETSQVHSRPDASGTLIPMVAIETNWENWADYPQIRSIQRSYSYDETGDTRVCNLITNQNYDLRYNMVYRITGPAQDEENFTPSSEMQCTYNAQDYLTEERNWKYVGGVKLADIVEMSEFNENNLCVKQEYHQGRNTGADDWVPWSKFIYEYDELIRLRKYRYVYFDPNGGGGDIIFKSDKLEEGYWYPDSGEGNDYDLNKDISDLFIPIQYQGYLKVTATYRFAGEDKIPDLWRESKASYYWSEVTTSSIKGQTNDASLSVYPNPVADILYISSSNEDLRVSLYNLQGSLLLQTTDNQVDMSLLPAGIYIVDVNGAKTKVVKK